VWNEFLPKSPRATYAININPRIFRSIGPTSVQHPVRCGPFRPSKSQYCLQVRNPRLPIIKITKFTDNLYHSSDYSTLADRYHFGAIAYRLEFMVVMAFGLASNMYLDQHPSIIQYSCSCWIMVLHRFMEAVINVTYSNL